MIVARSNSNLLPSSTLPRVTKEKRTGKSLVAIDRSLENYQQLLRAMEGRAEVIVIDGGSDPLVQISQALSETGAETLQIVCHGKPGTLYLGETLLNSSNIGKHTYLLSEWGIKEIQLYACNVADEEFLRRLHQLTGANIAATREKVGNANLGGTSQLENQIGENKLLSEAIANYPGLLEIEFTPSKDSPIELKDNNAYFAFGDFNKDGKLDRAILEEAIDPDNFSTSTKVKLQLGNGKGKFQASGKSLELPGSPSSIKIGELDKDGNLDAVVVTSAFDPTSSLSLNKITALKGDGKGKLTVDTKLDLKNVNLISFADLNNDGLDDLSLSKYSPSDGTNKIEILLRNNKGFKAAKGDPFATNDPFLNPVVMGDFNGDGFMDRATSISDYVSNKTTVSIELGDNKGKFKPLENSSIELEGSGTLEIAELNGDRNLDLVVQTYSSNPQTYISERKVSSLLGDGKGKFTLDTEVSLGENDYDTRIEDINNDGLDDIAVNSFESSVGSGIGVYFGKKNGKLGESADVKVENPLNLVGGGDVNNDGNPDLVLVLGPYQEEKIQVLLGNGKGKFSEGKTVELEGNAPATVKLADINGDGNLDIVADEFTYDYLSGSTNQTRVLLGNGKGNFKSAGKPIQVKSDAKSVVGYFDGDKNLDMVVARNVYNSYNLNVITQLLSGSGDGKFTPQPGIPGLKNVQKFAAGDFTGDGKMDLLAVTSVSGEDTSLPGTVPVGAGLRKDSFEILKGNGKGEFSFVEGSKVELEEPVDRIVVGDFDGDGKLDVAASQNSYVFFEGEGPADELSIPPPYYGYGGQVSVFLGNGKGKFPTTKTLDTKEYGDFALGDFNGDGNIDVAQINAYSYETINQFSVLLNQGEKTPETVKSAKSYTLKEGEPDLLLTGNAKIHGTGNELDNQIAGNKKANKLQGLTGNDTLTGGKGHDIFMGGPGDDTLTGGKGKDRFKFGSDRSFNAEDFGVDTITDFKTAQKDSIVLSETTFDKLESIVGKGFSIIAEFEAVNGDNKPQNSEAFIVYNQTTGDLFYNANGSKPGFGSGGKFATLEGAPELKASDFSLVD
ncbi:MAG: FG-GAP-like repeat-containing protein [Cyanobacteriota bacterium]|nr:FG-GAP-like repeat-containing protein [Cyanobacteriota bacterium]